jgi:hypothetical protein
MTINSTVSMPMQRPRMLRVGDSKAQNWFGNMAGSKILSDCCRKSHGLTVRVYRLTVRAYWIVAFAIDRRTR